LYLGISFSPIYQNYQEDETLNCAIIRTQAAKIRAVSIILSLGALLILIGAPASAQPYWDSDNTEKVIKGVENATASIINDSFVPMTHYTDKNWTVRVVPAVFRVDRAYDDPEIEGDDFYGWGSGIGAGYALTDRLMVYGIYDYTDLEGDLKGKIYGDEYQALKTGVKYTSNYFTTGVGYDIIKGKSRWSIPLYVGLFAQFYDAELDLPKYTNALPAYTIDGTVSGSGGLYGVAGGIALSYRLLDQMKIAPYYLMGVSFNEAEFDAEIDHSLSASQIEEDLKTGGISTSMLGLNISYDTGKSLTFSLSVGGMVSSQFDYYSENFQDGLDIKSVIFAVSYNGGGY
jgi:hypothetical protein